MFITVKISHLTNAFCFSWLPFFIISILCHSLHLFVSGAPPDAKVPPRHGLTAYFPSSILAWEGNKQERLSCSIYSGSNIRHKELSVRGRTPVLGTVIPPYISATVFTNHNPLPVFLTVWRYSWRASVDVVERDRHEQGTVQNPNPSPSQSLFFYQAVRAFCSRKLVVL